MKVIIVRHAQTYENVKTNDVGYDLQTKLNEEGIKQAQKISKRLKSEDISYAYTSPQIRTVHTAKEILKYHPKAKLIKTEYLKEHNLGIYETVPKNIWKEVRAKSKKPFHLFKPKNGESYADLQKRVKTFFSNLLDKHENDTILIVSHGVTIGMLLLSIFNKPITEENYRAFKPDNTALTVLEIFKDKPAKIHYFNNLDHLNET